MFRSLSDHHQGVCKFLVKVTELKCSKFLVVMWQPNVSCHYVFFPCGEVCRLVGITPLTEQHIMTRYVMLPHHHKKLTTF
jgi:hypothetical protein